MKEKKSNVNFKRVDKIALARFHSHIQYPSGKKVKCFCEDEGSLNFKQKSSW